MFVILTLLFCAQTPAQAVEKINVMTYHKDAPFLFDDGETKGLSLDLVDYLNMQAPDQFEFFLAPLPRKRLNLYLERDFPGIVPWVNNAWFQDLDETKYLWTNGFKTDGDVIIVRKGSDFVYERPESLIGKRLGSILGFRFAGIDELVNADKIEREDTSSLVQSLRMLNTDRVDAVIGPKSATLFALAREHLNDRLRIEPIYHSKYERKFLILQNRDDIKDFLNAVIAKMPNDPAWQEIIDRYK